TKGRIPTPCTTPSATMDRRGTSGLHVDAFDAEPRRPQELGLGTVANRAKCHVVLGRVDVRARDAARIDAPPIELEPCPFGCGAARQRQEMEVDAFLRPRLRLCEPPAYERHPNRPLAACLREHGVEHLLRQR